MRGGSVATLCLFSSILLALGCQPNQDLQGVIRGDSMAPTLLGEHWNWTCHDCDYSFSFELPTSKITTTPVVCPNCSYQHNQAFPGSRQPADQVTITPATKIDRWDVVAFQIPGSTALGIKRVIGLPDESVEFIQGDLYANGSLIRKSWPRQIDMRVLVYDSRYFPRSIASPRWIPHSGDNTKVTNRSKPSPDSETEASDLDILVSQWASEGNRWKFIAANKQAARFDQGNQAVQPNETKVANPTSPDQFDWLSYRHWRGCRHPGERTDSFLIEDLDTYNHSLTRSLNPMHDLMLELDGNFSVDATPAIRIYRGDHRLEICIDLSAAQVSLFDTNFGADQREEKSSSERSIKRIFPISIQSKQVEKIVASTFDQQLILTINERVVLEQVLDPVFSYQTFESDKEVRVLEIGGEQGTMELQRIRIYRDLYYSAAADADVGLSAQPDVVMPACFYVVGDNVPVSTDSRHWKNGGIRHSAIRGKVSR